MPHALLLLLKLQARAMLRRAVRGAGSVRGAIFLIFGAALFLLFMLPAAISGAMMPRTDPQLVLAVVPLGMLAIAIFSLTSGGGERAVAFTPPEVEFLFAGPFTRRQVLAYRIIKTLAGAMFTALLFSVFFLRHAVSWPACFAGSLMALFFIQLLSMSIVLIGQSVGQRAYTLGRKIGVGLLLAMLALAAGPVVLKGMDAGWLPAVQEVRASTVGRVLLAPMEPFGRILTAATAMQLLGWTSLALLVNGLLLGVVMWLDANYLETSAARSEAIYTRTQRARRAGLASTPSASLARYRLPMLPYLHGAGPVAWRQLTTALRNSRTLLLMLAILAMCGVPMILARQKMAAGAMVGVAMWATFILAPMLRFDFRGELDSMDWLKSLPVGGMALAAGELLAPVLVMTLLQSMVFVGSAAIAGHADWVLLLGLAIALPFNTLLFGMENVLFLLFPMRFASAPGDFQGFGRQMLLMFAKLTILFICAGVCAGVGAGVYFLFGRSLPAAIIAGALLLVAQAAAMLPLLAWAFGRFDPSRDVPP